MYRVNSIMGDTAFQVIKEPNVIIRTFYTESVAKEFCDRLTAEEYFERFVCPIAYDEPFNEAIKKKSYNQALEDIFNLAKQNAYDDGVDYSIGLRKLDELMANIRK